LLSSCVPHRKLVTFGEEIDQMDLRTENIMQKADIRIQPNDILHIVVYDENQEAVAPFNVRQMQQGMNMGGGGGGQQIVLLLQGYLVSEEGTIRFPELGEVKLAGFNREEAKAYMENLLEKYLTTPSVEVRFLNFRVNILGEVRAPGTYTFPQENITLFEALATAGDFTDLANRENVVLIRNAGDKREITRLNLLTTEIFESPYYYVEQNDIIYVEPLRAKTAAPPAAVTRNISVFTGIASLTALIISLFN